MSLATQISALATRVATEFKTIRSTFVPNTRTVAGKALSDDVTIGAADLSATGTRDATTVLHGDNTWATPDPGGTFDPHRSLYVPPGVSLSAWRSKVLAAKYGRATTVAVIGSSSVVGVGAPTILDGWAHLLRDRFADAGYPIQGTGLMFVGGARLASDPRWTWSGSVTVPGDGTFQPKLHATIPNGAWAQVATDVAGTRVRVHYLNDGGPFSVSIDGGSATTITPAGGATYGSWESAALSATTHTVRVTGTSGTPAQVVAVQSYDNTLPGLHLTVAGLSGSTSNAWYAGGPGSALVSMLQRVPALCVVAVNGNDFNLDVERSTMTARYTQLTNGLRYFSCEPLFVIMPHVNGQDLDDYREHASVLYEVADAEGVAVIDMQNRWGSYALANAAGLFADGTHPSQRGHEMYADAIFDVIGTPDSPEDIDAAPATQAINAQTSAYTLVASDAGKLVTMTSSTARALTVPANVFTAGQRVDIADRGTARVTVVAGASMTVNPPPGGSLVMEGRYAYASIVFISPTQADLVGLVAAA